jgi:hypothetical protein
MEDQSSYRAERTREENVKPAAELPPSHPPHLVDSAEGRKGRNMDHLWVRSDNYQSLAKAFHSARHQCRQVVEHMHMCACDSRLVHSMLIHKHPRLQRQWLQHRGLLRSTTCSSVAGAFCAQRRVRLDLLREQSPANATQVRTAQRTKLPVACRFVLNRCSIDIGGSFPCFQAIARL